ncbi:universal stress protein [Microbacterium sp. No. 7]|uniref:universal stress protein n=1 Tax=Microbacterium sp. No. 7 TaxID=1714373 RepID=UPI0006CF5BDB|nr:universal stress protein [Microbacterium sp. No. 7]ALJ19030.1 universal stress protein UspA [Microbacterium sp. No. 7]
MSDVILVGVSGAPVSRRAVDWAVARAAERHQRVELIAVVGGALGTVGEESVVRDALAATQEMLDEHVARVADRGVAVTTRVERGNPVSVLADASAHAALLVLGSDYRGEGGPARGPHGVRTAAAAKCPVVVVPDIDLGERSGVVVGIDGSEVSEHAIRFAAAEADRLGEPLIAVAVWTPLHAPRNSSAVYPELYLANMQAATEEVLALSLAGLREDYPDLEVVRHVVQGYPAFVLNEMAHTARLAVVGTHGRGAIARFLLGSISQEVLARLATVTAVVR